jgi:hypothetical protein
MPALSVTDLGDGFEDQMLGGRGIVDFQREQEPLARDSYRDLVPVARTIAADTE